MRALTMTLVLSAFGASAVAAQLPSASAATLDRGQDATATGGGFAAIASNPAGLALASSPGFSMTLPSVSARAGIGPVGLGDLNEWEGRLLPDMVKDDWLTRIANAGGQSGGGGLDMTALALTIGNFGLQVSARSAGLVALSDDAAELFLYGNAGRSGTAGDFDLASSMIEGFAVATTALAFGTTVTDGMHVGVTAKYSVGLGLATARNVNSFVTGDPLAVQLDFPVLYPDFDSYSWDQSSGFGMDVGAIFEGDPLIVGVTIENLFNTFAWDLTGYSYVAGQAFFNEADSDSDFSEFPLSAAPAQVRDYFEGIAEELGLATRVEVGASMEAAQALRVFANLQKSLGDGMDFDPDFYGGVGAEWTGVSVLHLRAHGAVITDGYQLGGGASLVLGPVHLSSGATLRSESSNDSLLATFALSFGSH